MYITNKECFKELEDMGFYLEGNTYKYGVGRGKCIAICKINREIIIPKTNIVDKIISKFIKDSIKNNIDKIMLELWNRNIVNNI